MNIVVRAVLDGLDFSHIDREVPAFATRPSTVEHIVVYLWGEIVPRFVVGLRHLKL